MPNPVYGHSHHLDDNDADKLNAAKKALEQRIITDLTHLGTAACVLPNLFGQCGYYQATLETLLAMQTDIVDIVEKIKKIQSV